MIDNKQMAWCPGCGNFIILRALDKTLHEKLKLNRRDYVIVSGIGQAAKLPHHMQPCNGFAGLHGRSIPNAIAMKIVNPRLKVLVFSGDGDLLGEGGNHFIHAIRRNISVSCFLHDNQVYGLTKGQVSPTIWKNAVSAIQYEGVKSFPLNPLPFALVLGATFVARVSVSDQKQMVEVMKKAIEHKGFSLVQILQTCPSFNKTRSFKWYKENTFPLDSDYDKTNIELAMKESNDMEKNIKLGVFYEKNLLPYEESFSVLKGRNLVDDGLKFSFSRKELSKLMS